MNKEPTISVGVRIPVSIVKRIDANAKKGFRTRAAEINRLLKRSLYRKGAK